MRRCAEIFVLVPVPFCHWNFSIPISLSNYPYYPLSFRSVLGIPFRTAKNVCFNQNQMRPNDAVKEE